jgi:hypothetical protein
MSWPIQGFTKRKILKGSFLLIKSEYLGESYIRVLVTVMHQLATTLLYLYTMKL